MRQRLSIQVGRASPKCAVRVTDLNRDRRNLLRVFGRTRARRRKEIVRRRMVESGGSRVCGIVPVNHISASLTTQPQRRRFAPLQITVVLAGFAYVLRITWPIRAVNIVAALTGSPRRQ